MTDLADHVQSLRNMIARPGLFGTLFPETTEDDLVQVLRDGLAECHLEGMLLEYESDDNGVVIPDLPSGAMSMVVIFSGARLLQAEMLNRMTDRQYTAGPVSLQETQATNIVRDIMRDLKEQKKRIIETRRTIGAGHAFHMADAYLVNAFSRINPYSYVTAEW